MGNAESQTETEQKPLRNHVLRSSTGGFRSAILTGATGATGKFVLAQMIISPEWSKITVIHRRDIDLDGISKQCNIPFTETQKAKVSIHVMDMAKLCENDDAIETNTKLFVGHEVSICTLGSTREKAKDAATFRAIDFDIVRDIGILSKRADVRHFSLLSSTGANANVWANEWKISAPLWYLKVKGEIENELMSQKFNRLSIFRPGFLAREERATGLISKLFVCDLGNVLVYDAESDDIDPSVTEPHVIYDTNDIALVLDSAVKNFNVLLPKNDEVVESKEANEDKPQEEQQNVEVKEVVKEEAKEDAEEVETEKVNEPEEEEEEEVAADNADKKDELPKTQEAQDSQEDFVKIEKEDVANPTDD
eukprot:96149_1